MLVRFNKRTIVGGDTYEKDSEHDLANDLADQVVEQGNGVVVGLGGMSQELHAVTDANGNTVLVGAGGAAPIVTGLAPTGNDQTAEIQQYLNDTVGGNVFAEFGAGDFIITGDITVYSRRVAEWEGSYGYGLNFRGVAPNVTRILDARANKSTPAILITEPSGVDVGNRAMMANISNFAMLSCNTSAVPNALGTLSGVGIMTKASSGSGYGAHVLHSSRIDRVLFTGYDYPLSLDDCSQLELSHLRFTEFLTAARLGMNCDMLNFNHCGWGSEAFGVTYRNSSVCVENAWDAGVGSPGGANALKFENGWVMKVGTFFRNKNPTVNDTVVGYIGMYFEQVKRYYYADHAVTNPTRVVFDRCHFSRMNENDHASSVKSHADFGSKIQFGSTGINTAANDGPVPYVAVRNCSADGTPSTALITFNSRIGRISWENNDIPASSSHGHVRCIRDGWENWRTLTNAGTPSVGRWELGDDQASGLRVLHGDPITVFATIASAATYNLNHINGTLFELTLPDGNCTIDYAAYAAGPPSPLLASGTEIDIILIAPASVTGTRTITWGARMAMNAATLTYSGTEQGKRAMIKLRAPKDSGNMMQLVSRDPVFI